MAEIVYIWDAKKCITWVHASIQLNEEWIITVEEWSPEDQMCKNAKLRSLSELSEKYLKAPKSEWNEKKTKK